MSYQSGKSTFQYLSFFVSLFFNALLIFLILTKSPRKMGNYRYLMIYFSCFAMFFSTIDVIVGPYVHSYGKGFCVLMDRRTLMLGESTEYILLCVLCGCFGVTITFFAIHFVFRFFALERKGRLAYFKGFYFGVWLTVPVIFGGFWSAVVGYFLAPNEEKTEYLRKSVLESYNLTMENITYFGALYWRETTAGKEELVMDCFVANIFFASMIVVSFSVVCYYGYLSYQRITALIDEGESSYTRNLQKQLYKALVVQAIIPSVLMYFPVFTYLILPIFGVNIPLFSKLVTILYAAYPAIDPLPLFFIIDNYRLAVAGFCGLHQNRVAMSEDEISRGPTTI